MFILIGDIVWGADVNTGDFYLGYSYVLSIVSCFIILLGGILGLLGGMLGDDGVQPVE